MTAKSTNSKPFYQNKAAITLAVVLIFIITLVTTFFIIIKVGEYRLRQSLVVGEKLEQSEQTIDDNTVYHNGKAYFYNEKLINILLIGVDKNSTDKLHNGQADALYLFSMDPDSGKVKIVSISRNTVCKFDVLTDSGKVFGTETAQICLAYSYGNNDVNSSKNCVKAVSNLLYSIPINGYYTIYMDSVADIVNSVGGVKIQVTEADKETHLADKIGKTVTLEGNDALSYIQSRGDSNAPRVERQKRFISGFIESAKSAVKKDLTLPIKIANKLSKETITDIDITSTAYLALEAVDWKVEFVNISGEYGIENNLEVFKINEQELKNLIIGNFYIEN